MRLPGIRQLAFLQAAMALALVSATHVASAQNVMRDVPAKVDADASYVFYLHGRIVEEQGPNAVSPDFGHYEYDGILAELARTPAVVISEPRARGTDVNDYAAKVMSQIARLKSAGVKSSAINVVGASKGGWIAAKVAMRLGDPDVRYVLIGGCGYPDPASAIARLNGSVLWILERTDFEGSRNCAAEVSSSPGLRERRQITLETGLRHGFLYRPLPEWVNPVQDWIRGR